MENKKSILIEYFNNIQDAKLKNIIEQVLVAEKTNTTGADKIRAIKKIIENENK